MSKFFDDPDIEQKLPLLVSRFIALDAAVKEGNISVDDLCAIAKMSAAEMEEQQNAPVERAVHKLNDLLERDFDAIVNIQDSMTRGLQLFDEEHADYLSLLSLSSSESGTSFLNLNDLASLYPIIIQHMSCTKHTGELGDEYSVSLDLLAARASWLQWVKERPERFVFDASSSAHAGIFEKFTSGKLKKDEWLTDLDIQRALKWLIPAIETHVLPFKADNIGLALHFERKKHDQDDPKVPYVIPLIVNLGEDQHSRVDSRGVHWTRMLVRVDPTQIPAGITVDYNDELQLSEASKSNIRKTIQDALKYEEEVGSIIQPETYKKYAAFPASVASAININGSGLQKDGYTCGYRAIKGLVADLFPEGHAERDRFNSLLASDDADALRNEIYRLLLTQHEIGPDARKAIPEDMLDDEQKRLNPDLIAAQLLVFSNPEFYGAGKTKGRALDAQQLREVLQRSELAIKVEKVLSELPLIRDIDPDLDNIQVDLQAILDLEALETDEMKRLALDLVFKKLASFSIKQVTFVNEINIDFVEDVRDKLDRLPSTIALAGFAKNQELMTHLLALNLLRTEVLARSDSLRSAKAGELFWEPLFESMLFLPNIVNTVDDKLFWNLNDNDNTPFAKFLDYSAQHEDRFKEDSFRFPHFIMRPADGNMDNPLSALQAHLESNTPFLPFKKFTFGLRAEHGFIDQLEAILNNTHAKDLELIQLELGIDADLSLENIQKLTALIADKQIKTILSIIPHSQSPTVEGLKEALKELENASLANRRALASNNPDAADPQALKPVEMGPLGRVIMRREPLGPIETEMQVEQQQQQQVQQQVQTTVTQDNLPDQDELPEEVFLTYSAEAEEPLDKNQFIAHVMHVQMSVHEHAETRGKFDKIDPQDLWRQITGDNKKNKLNHFRYGIKKITRDAADKLLEHADEFRFGLHPDNLPHGFSLQENDQKELVLAYSAINPPVNLNKSPLTMQLKKPRYANTWAGNALQFMSMEQAQALYAKLNPGVNDPSGFEDAVQNFFSFRNTDSELSLEQKKMVFDAFIIGQAGADRGKTIIDKIQAVFGEKPDGDNLLALSEILYEQNPDVLLTLLEKLERIKKVKGEDFFKDFKACFIDPSKNLNELTGQDKLEAMDKLLTFSEQKTAWWRSLTMQHSSDINDKDGFTVLEDKKRWSDLAELTDGFVYFCDKLEDAPLNLKLPFACPLTGVADMRVGLDRLLSSILPNALDKIEQFQVHLKDLSLGPLEAFYASRYEGFKLVTSEMMLNRSALAQNKAGSNSTLRCLKELLGTSIDSSNLRYSGRTALPGIKATFLRYIATFNHRASYERYCKAFDILEKQFETHNDEYLFTSLLLLLANFGVGKKGKFFTDKDITDLCVLVNSESKRNILSVWRQMRHLPMQPDLAEIVHISNMEGNSPKVMSEIQDLMIRFKDQGQNVLDIVCRLAENPNQISLTNFNYLLLAVEGLKSDEAERLKERDTAQSEFDLPPSERLALARLLTVCHAKDVSPDLLLQDYRDLVNAVITFKTKHGAQISADLVELLGCIVVDSDSTLPRIEQLKDIVNQLKDEASLDYNRLENLIKEELPPNCVINTHQAVAKVVEPQGNLQAVIAQEMNGIKKYLERYKGMLNENGGLYDKLSTAEGPSVLRQMLEKLNDDEQQKLNFAEKAALVGVKGEIKEVMLKTYKNMVETGIGRFYAKHQRALEKVVTQRLPQSLENKDFKDFADTFAREYQDMAALLANLKQAESKWPGQMFELINALDNATIQKYKLSLLVTITDTLNRESSQNKFSMELFKAMLDLPPDGIEVLPEVIACIYGDKDNPCLLNTEEKAQLARCAMRYCKEAPQRALRTTETLIKNKSDDFMFQLEILNEPSIELSEVEKIFAQLDGFADKTALFNYFKKVGLQNLRPFMTAINLGNDSTEKKSHIISIILKSAEKTLESDEKARKTAEKAPESEQNKLKSSLPYHKDTIENLISKLKEHDDKDLAGLNVPGVPSLDALKVMFDRPKFNLNELTNMIDKKKRSPEKLQAHFNSEKLHHYLNKLVDLNHNRVLLKSDREKLERWFIYVNAIGNTHPLQSAGQPIKDLSQEEIKRSLDDCRKTLADENSTKDERLKAKLEAIALLREAMYRGSENGSFPRPTQILYLLTAALRDDTHFIGQIPTGQGKSMIGALVAAMAWLEGKTVDVCTTKLNLAEAGLKENEGFFACLGIPTILISAGSNENDYQEGAIHYSTMADIALYRAKTQLKGKTFPEKTTLAGDEIDFYTLDDDTRYRYAIWLDPVKNPYESPYTWIYETIIAYVDSNASIVKSDEDHRKDLEKCLKTNANNQEKRGQLSSLMKDPESYRKRLDSWIETAVKSGQLAEDEDISFRVVQIPHPDKARKDEQVSKACKLVGGEPNFAGTYTGSMQSFLHLRLRKKYRQRIENKQTPDFLVLPESTTVTSMNSKILMESYKEIEAFTATPGSRDEISEQYAKYGFRFVSIPPFEDSRRKDLPPILTNAKWVEDLEAEKRDHVNRIVKEVIRHIRAEKNGPCAPVLIHCLSKKDGQAIEEALRVAMAEKGLTNQVQGFYSSEKPTEKERIEEGEQVKERAGKSGQITISTVFNRGTDIKPEHPEGLYTVLTTVDTAPHTVEGVQRSVQQSRGRAARSGAEGASRIIVRRSEFKDVFDSKELRRLPSTEDALDKAISRLNAHRNRPRSKERGERERFDAIKDYFYKDFERFLSVLHKQKGTTGLTSVENRLLRHWNVFRQEVDNRWQELESDGNAPEDNAPEDKALETLVQFACDKWRDLAGKGGVLQEELQNFAKRSGTTPTLPDVKDIQPDDIIDKINAQRTPLTRSYIKQNEYMKLDSGLTAEEVCADFASDDKDTKAAAATAVLANTGRRFSQGAYSQTLSRFGYFDAYGEPARVQAIMSSLLYSRYKAWQTGNHLSYAHFKKESRVFAGNMVKYGNQNIINAISAAQKNHFVALTNHRGNHEAKKGAYLSSLMGEWQKELPTTLSWKGKDLLPNMQAPMRSLLQNYQNNWWDGHWVSRDRKAVVRRLLAKLDSADNPVDLLAAIRQAKREVIDNDAAKGRSIADGLQGRLYGHLSEMELKVKASMFAAQLDEVVDEEFQDIAVVLRRFQIARQDMIDEGLVQVLVQKGEPEAKYRQLSEYFSKISNLSIFDPRLKNKDWQLLYNFCKQKQTELVKYFAQSDNCSKLNETRSIQVYQALSQSAGMLLPQARFGEYHSEKSALTSCNLLYHDQKIRFELGECSSQVNDSPVYKQVNRIETYRDLLREIETQIVEKSADSPVVQFQSITLREAEEGFELTIEMLLDHQKASVDFHINSRTGSVICSAPDLPQLDRSNAEPVIAESKVPGEFEKLEAEISQQTKAAFAQAMNTDKAFLHCLKAPGAKPSKTMHP